MGLFGLFGRPPEQKRSDFVKRAEDIGGAFQVELYRSSEQALAGRVDPERAGQIAAAIANYVCRFGLVTPDHSGDAELMRLFEEQRQYVFSTFGDTFKSNTTRVLILLGAAWNIPLEKFRGHLKSLAAEGLAKVGPDAPDVRRELPEELHLYVFEAANLGR